MRSENRSTRAAEPSLASARLNWLIGLCSVALFAPLVWPLLTGRIFAFGDLQSFNLPIRHLYQSALRAGDSVLWTPALFSGFYLHGEGQAGMFHPLHQLLYRSLPLGVAFNLEILVSYIAAFAGTYWFLRRLSIGTTGALFGAMLFAFDGFLLLHYLHMNLVAVVVHIPWLLAGIDVVLAARTSRSIAAGYAVVAIVLASALLIGFPQSVWFALLAASAFTIFRADQAGAWRRLPWLAAAVLTGVLIGAIQWLPTADATALSIRPLHGPEFRQSYSLHPWNLLQLWSPYVFVERVYSSADYPWVHEFGIYSTAFLLVAPLWLWVRRTTLGERRALAVAAMAFAGVLLVLTLGRYGELNALLGSLPGFRWSRAPARYIVLVHFALVIVAALAFDDLLSPANPATTSRSSTRSWPIWIPAALSVATIAIVTLAAQWPMFQALPLSRLPRAAVGALFVIAITALVALAGRRKPWAIALLVIVTAADLGAWGIREVYRHPPQPLSSLAWGYPQSTAATERIQVTDENLGDLMVLNGYRMTDGYAALPPALHRWSSDAVSLRLSGATHTWTPGGAMTPVPGALPRARLLAEARVMPDSGGETAGRVVLDLAGTDPATTAIVDRDVPPLAGPPGTARTIADRPGRLVVETNAPGRQILAITERYDRGWQATADGVSIKTVRVHGDYLGAIVEPGTHRVELEFAPRSFAIGARVSLVGLGLLGLTVAGITRMRGVTTTAGRRAIAGSSLWGSIAAAPAGWTAAACGAVFFAALLRPLLSGRVFVFNDLAWFHLPFRFLYQRALQAGDSLLWTPAVLSGFYIHGEGQIGLFHPLHLLLYGTLPLYAAFDLELFANYAGLFGGTYWLLRRLTIDRSASIFGALLFTFGGFNLLHHHHVNVIAVVAHIPWLLAAVDVLLTDADPRRRSWAFAGIALIFASQHLLGFPQGVWWTAIALGGFVAWRLGSDLYFPTGLWRSDPKLLTVAAALLIGLLIGGIQLWPTAETSARSIRPLLSRDFAMTYSLHPLNLLQLWSPYVFADRVYGVLDYPWAHEFGIYSGAVLLVALPWLWIRRRALQARRPLVVACAIFAAATLVLALGRHGGVAWLVTYLPVVGSFRAPVRYIVLTQLALAVLAAIAFDDLARYRERLSPRDTAILCIPAALSVLTTILLNTRAIPLDYPFSTTARAGLGVLFMLLTTGLFLLAARRITGSLAALVVVTAVDLWVWGMWPVYRERPVTVASLTRQVPRPPDDPGLAYAYVEPEPKLPGDVLALAGYRLTNGYVALFPSTYYHMDSSGGQQLAGARWRFNIEAWKTPMNNPAPRARLLADTHVSDDLRRDENLVDLHRTALLERAVPVLTGPPGTARVVIDRPGYIVVETTAPGRQLLALTEHEHPGWTATAEGTRLEMVKIHGDFLGCVVEAGRHRIELRFMPRSFVNGAIVSAVGVILLPIGFIVVRRRW